MVKKNGQKKIESEKKIGKKKNGKKKNWSKNILVKKNLKHL